MPRGWFLMGISFSQEKEGRGKFLAQELLYQKDFGYEEWIYSGDYEKAGIDSVLHPKTCLVRSGPSLKKKRGLLRQFDCDHRILTFLGSPHQLERNLSGTRERVNFEQRIPEAEEPIAILLETQEGDSFWGFYLTGLKDQLPSFVWDRKALKWNPIKEIQEKDRGSLFLWKRAFSN